MANLGGRIAGFMGHEVLALFGYPKAHEDDAERAVHAALDLAAKGTAALVRATTGANRNCYRAGYQRTKARSENPRLLLLICETSLRQTRSLSPRALGGCLVAHLFALILARMNLREFPRKSPLA